MLYSVDPPLSTLGPLTAPSPKTCNKEPAPSHRECFFSLGLIIFTNSKFWVFIPNCFLSLGFTCTSPQVVCFYTSPSKFSPLWSCLAGNIMFPRFHEIPRLPVANDHGVYPPRGYMCVCMSMNVTVKV